jgi:hypothetical protein
MVNLQMRDRVGLRAGSFAMPQIRRVALQSECMRSDVRPAQREDDECRQK